MHDAYFSTKLSCVDAILSPHSRTWCCKAKSLVASNTPAKLGHSPISALSSLSNHVRVGHVGSQVFGRAAYATVTLVRDHCVCCFCLLLACESLDGVRCQRASAIGSLLCWLVINKTADSVISPRAQFERWRGVTAFLISVTRQLHRVESLLCFQSFDCLCIVQPRRRGIIRAHKSCRVLVVCGRTVAVVAQWKPVVAVFESRFIFRS